MKHSTLLLILLVIVILMVKSPKKTTSQITVGENAAAKVASATLGGLFSSPSSKGK